MAPSQSPQEAWKLGFHSPAPGSHWPGATWWRVGGGGIWGSLTLPSKHCGLFSEETSLVWADGRDCTLNGGWGDAEMVNETEG